MNRATRNNVSGLVLPQPVVAGISGGSGDPVWSSATGLLVNWEPFDFGVRGANVASADAALRRASASADVTDLQVATVAAEAFRNVVATEQTLRTAEASVERARVFHEVVSARVDAGLRPGVDAARARAELAVAETQRIFAEQNVQVARVILAQYTGREPADIMVSPGRLLVLPPAEAPVAPSAAMTPARPAAHPLATEQNAAIEESRARLRLFERSYMPRFNLLLNTYARGTGALPNQSGLAGLKPSVQNWAVGLNVIFPLLDRPALEAREQAERQRQVAETARYDRVLEDLDAQMGRAQAVLDGARRAAANTPFELDAARATEQQATARYQSGLAIIVEVADAQRLLTKAEIDDAIAKLSVWRGLLLVSAAEGDIEPFLGRTQP
jgi:outer membrane protein TolC